MGYIYENIKSIYKVRKCKYYSITFNYKYDSISIWACKYSGMKNRHDIAVVLFMETYNDASPLSYLTCKAFHI